MMTSNERNLRQIIIWGSAVGAGFGAASLAALQPHLDFVFSYRSVIAFILATALVSGYWKLIFRSLEEPSLKGKRNVATAVVCLLGLVALLYPIRYIAPNNYGEVMTGLITAFIALSGVATLLLMTARFFREDEASEEKTVGH
jgi:hypothetical protein